MGCLFSSCFPRVTKLFTICDKSTTPDLSRLFSLPRDLTWMILDHVPESIPQLRLGSQALRSLVDEYILHRVPRPLVQDLTLTFKKTYNEWETMVISMEISMEAAKCFAWRVLSLRPPDLKRLHSIIIIIEKQKGEAVWMVYQLKFFVLNNYSILANFLSELIREKIGRAVIECDNTLYFCAKLLERLRFNKLKIDTNVLSDMNSANIFPMIEMHAIDQLYLMVRRNVTSYPVNLLLRLSAQLQSLLIEQIGEYYADNERSMFDAPEVDWGSVIVDMFSGKLHNLFLIKCWLFGYMSRPTVIELSERLAVLDKPFWYSAVFKHCVEEPPFVINGAIVKVNCNPVKLYGASTLSDIMPSPLHIFALPTVFLRELMKLMDVKDRLKLLHTCHGFDTLVAESNVEFCDTAGVHFEIDKFSLGFDKTTFDGMSYSREIFDEMLSLRTRLFNKINVREFFVLVDNCQIPLEFIREFLMNFEIGILKFRVGSQSELDQALVLMSDFPGSKYELVLDFIPDDEILLAIPAMENLAFLQQRQCYFLLRDQIADRLEGSISPISVNVLINLIIVHKYLFFTHNIVEMTSDGWTETLQLISSIEDDRTVKLAMEAQTLTTLLRDHGIIEFPRAGEVRGEFTIIEMESDRVKRLSYKNCRIQIDPPLIFTHFFRGRPVVITMSNTDNLS